MAKIVFGMLQSLDGYVGGVQGELQLPPPDPSLFRHFVEHVGGLGGILYGRRMYEVMRYWDEDRPEWGTAEHEFAAAWRGLQKWVASRTLSSVGANTALVRGDVGAFVRKLKAELSGEVDVAGPDLAGCLTDLGLIDEYRLYVRPFVLGKGKAYFARARPPLRCTATERLGDDAVRLTYVPG